MLPTAPRPTARYAIRHGSPGPNRNTHARAATAIASNASATPLPAGSTGPSSGSSATAHRVKCARICSARSTNRRSQPRTVSAGTPNRAAIRRYPSPATLASIAAPITATSSWRRDNATSGSSTCVPAQPRHRARRGRNNRSPTEQRNTRSRACPHGPNTPRHDGHAKPPADQLSLDQRLLGAYDQHRVPPPASKRALPTTIKLTGGLSRVQERAKPAKPTTTIPAINGTSTSPYAGFKRRSTAA